jgi:outer membrane protein
MRSRAFSRIWLALAGLALPLLTLFVFGQPASAFGQTQPAPLATAAAQQPAPPAGPVRQLSIDDAVRLALEQNLNLRVERLNPQIEDLNIAQARSAWTPNASTTVSANNRDNPPTSFLEGGTGTINQETFSTNVGINQVLPWGANYFVNWDSARFVTNSIFTNFNPYLSSNLRMNYTQPFLRNFKIDGLRTQLLISKNTREISDVDLRDTVVRTVADVKNAYWSLVFARNSLRVSQQSLDLARESLRNNRIRVEVGTMAPIDIVEGQAEVARNEESVIIAEGDLKRNEDNLRALIMDPSAPDFWNLTLEPTDAPQFQHTAIDIEAAVRTALDKRTDIRRARKTLESSDINIRYYRNQTLPDVNLSVNYGLQGIGGTQFEPLRDFTPGSALNRAITAQRSFGSALSNIFGNDYPNWTVGVTIGYPIGRSNAEANLARSKLQYTQSQTQIKSMELQIATTIRDLGRSVNTNAKRVEATRSSRELAEQRLDAEQKKFGVGMTTTFFVLQAQRDLAQARNNELRAILDYNRSLVNFEAAQEAAIGGGGNISIAGGGGGGGGAASGGSQQQQQ